MEFLVFFVCTDSNIRYALQFNQSYPQTLRLSNLSSANFTKLNLGVLVNKSGVTDVRTVRVKCDAVGFDSGDIAFNTYKTLYDNYSLDITGIDALDLYAYTSAPTGHIYALEGVYLQ